VALKLRQILSGAPDKVFCEAGTETEPEVSQMPGSPADVKLVSNAMANATRRKIINY
jgi:hypothetical protein